MVEFTYQDYLKYQKYLARKQKMIDEGKYIEITNENQDKFAQMLQLISEKLGDEDFTYDIAKKEKSEAIMLMEESTPYVFTRK